MIAVASDLYPLVYDFLIKCGHSKSSKVFLKDINKKSSELKSFEDDLVQVYNKYLQEQNKNVSNKKKRKLDEVAIESEDHLPETLTKKQLKKLKKAEEKVTVVVVEEEELFDVIKEKKKKIKLSKVEIVEDVKKVKKISKEDNINSTKIVKKKCWPKKH